LKVGIKIGISFYQREKKEKAIIVFYILQKAIFQLKTKQSLNLLHHQLSTRTKQHQILYIKR
jgi:hypothetical protein